MSNNNTFNQNNTLNITGHKLSLEEARSILKTQFESVDTYKKIAQSTLGAASVTISLIGAFQLFGATVQPEHLVLYSSLFIAAMFFYIAIVVATVITIWPTKLLSGTDVDWDYLKNNIMFNKSDEQIYQQLISDYLANIEVNYSVIRWVQIKTIIVIGLLPFPIIMLLIAGIIPHWQN